MTMFFSTNRQLHMHVISTIVPNELTAVALHVELVHSLIKDNH